MSSKLLIGLLLLASAVLLFSPFFAGVLVHVRAQDAQPNVAIDPDPDPDPDPAPTPCATPEASTNGRLGAWSQNAPVQVVIQTGPGHFTDAEVNCLRTAFQNWNSANGVNGNASGVMLTVTTSSTPIATMNPDGSNPDAGGRTNVFQVSRQAPSNPMAVAITNGRTSGNARAYAVTLIHPEVGTDVSFGCAALTDHGP